VKGEILESRPLQKGRSRIFAHRVRFVDVSQPVRDSIELHCTQHAVPIDQLRLRNAGQPRVRKKGIVRNVRSERRRRVDLPVQLDLDDGRTPGGTRGRLAFMEDVSPSGARLVTDEPIAPGTLVHFAVPGTRIRGRGRTVFSRAMPTPLGVRFSVGVQRAGAGLPSDTLQGWRPIKRVAELIRGK